jgi:hypothetical protein
LPLPAFETGWASVFSLGSHFDITCAMPTTTAVAAPDTEDFAFDELEAEDDETTLAAEEAAGDAGDVAEELAGLQGDLDEM